MKNIFERNVSGMTEKLSRSTIGLAGCGGIGSNAAVSLVRAGAGKLIIADFDTVEPSNLNRQYFFSGDIGKKKTAALEELLLRINPDCVIEVYDKKLAREDIAALFGKSDILIEAFDRAESKQWLIEEWASLYPDRPIISGNGLSGYGEFQSLSIRKTGNIYFCGDGKSSDESGLCAARVAVVANMQANLAIELIMNNSGDVQ